MSSAEGSPASPSAPLEKEGENRTKDSSGLNLSASFAKFGPDGSLLRMSQGCLQSTLDGSLAEYSETWPNAGTMSNGILFQRPASGRYTPGIEFSSSVEMSTPTAHPDNYRSDEFRKGLLTPGEMVKQQFWLTPTAVQRECNPEQYQKRRETFGGERRAIYLQDAVKYWPTPCAQDFKRRGPNSQQQGLPEKVHNAQMWRTPSAADGMGGCGTSAKAITTGNMTRPSGALIQVTLKSQMAAEQLLEQGYSAENLPAEVNGQLNPMWVEWLMGFPQGWTDLDASETPSFPNAPSISVRGSSNAKEELA
jgi:hypothetical protein